MVGKNFKFVVPEENKIFTMYNNLTKRNEQYFVWISKKHKYNFVIHILNDNMKLLPYQIIQIDEIMLVSPAMYKDKMAYNIYVTASLCTNRYRRRWLKKEKFKLEIVNKEAICLKDRLEFDDDSKLSTLNADNLDDDYL